MASFWATERATHSGTPVAELALSYGDSLEPYVFARVSDDNKTEEAHEIVSFVVRRMPRGESLRALYKYLVQVHGALVYTLRAPLEGNTLVATVIGVPLTMEILGKVLLSTMLAVRALDCQTGLTEKFLRRAFADSAAQGYSVRIFAGDKPLQARCLHTPPIERRIIPPTSTNKCVAISRVHSGNLRAWRTFLHNNREYASIDWAALDNAASLLCHQSLFTACFSSEYGGCEIANADHAAVFVHAGPDHVHMLYHATRLIGDRHLLRFLRGVAAATGKSVIIDCASRLLATSTALRDESQPSTALPKGYTWFAHNLDNDVPDICPELPMM